VNFPVSVNLPAMMHILQSMEWTPASGLLASLAGVMTLCSAMLIFPGLASLLYKLEPHTQQVCKACRVLEFSHGSHLLYWAFTIVGGLLADAQVTCILLLPSMVALACYHYSAGSISHVILTSAFAVAVAYFGFVPLPTLQPMEWSPAAIFLTIITFLTYFAALPGLAGGKLMEKHYEQHPQLKDQWWDESQQGLLEGLDSGAKAKSYKRARELALSAHLLGAGCCQTAAIMCGGAQNQCLLVVFPCVMNGYAHWLKREVAEEKFGAVFCWIIAAALVGFGIVR